MTIPPQCPDHVMSQLDLRDPHFVTQTGAAAIWRVRRRDGGLAALKLYAKPHMGNEAAGFAFIAALDPQFAAKVYKTGSNFALIEWLPGPSLADISLAGDDARAARALVAVANGIHAQTANLTLELPDLHGLFQSLLDARPDLWGEQQREVFTLSQTAARHLLSSQQDIRPLHGDLHHNNIRKTDRGFCAFDAKGVLGERCYELANAFRHPAGLVGGTGPDRVQRLCDIWSQEFTVQPERLLQWVAAKTALSISWRSRDAPANTADFALLTSVWALLGNRNG